VHQVVGQFVGDRDLAQLRRAHRDALCGKDFPGVRERFPDTL